MITPEILNFIKQQTTSGASREQISSLLKQNGWVDADIAEAFTASVSGNKSIVSTPLSPPTQFMPPQIQQPIAPHRSVLKYIVVVVILLALLGSAGFFYFTRANNTTVATDQQKTTVANSQDNPSDILKIAYAPVPPEENSASIFRVIATSTISSADAAFLQKYYNPYVATNTPPLSESRKILLKYKDLLTAFENATNKKYYQCVGDGCSLSFIREIVRLATLNTFVLYKDGKTVEAQQYALKIVKFGQILTVKSDLTGLLIGWLAQDAGYNMLAVVKNPNPFSSSERTSLVQTLRDEQKQIYKVTNAFYLQGIDNVTNVDVQLLGVSEQDKKDTESFFEEFRKFANSTTWKPDVVKDWFNQSLAISLSNIDLPCGSVLKDSKIDIGFDPNDKNQTTDNIVGKTFYTQFYGSLDAINNKRCEIESLINTL